MSPLPSPVRQVMIDEFDLNQDGEINKQEFSARHA
jgi:Ca2+-binding EF-hand superfamily protein